MFPDIHIPAEINALDFSSIKGQLMDPCRGQGWDKEYCDQVHREYLRFLALVYYHPDKQILPSSIIDVFWHAHILDTRKYQVDCQRTLGHFLHHHPDRDLNLLREPEDAASRGRQSPSNTRSPSAAQEAGEPDPEPTPYEKMHAEVWQKTLRLYEKQYREPPPAHIWNIKPPCA